jgi:hypothetical protein
MIARKALLQSLKVVEPAVLTHPRYAANEPALTHFFFTGTHVVAIDGSIAISTPRRTKFTGGIPAIQLTKLLINSRAPVVDLQARSVVRHAPIVDMDGRHPVLEDHHDVLVRLGKAVVVLPMLVPDTYRRPAMPKQSALIDAQFLAAVAHCTHSMNPENARCTEGQGISFIRDDSVLYLYSTDANTISRAVLKPGPAVFKQRVILTAEFCQQMLRLAKRARVSRLGLTRDYAILAADDMVLYGKLLTSARPVDFERILQEHLPRDYAATMIAIPPKLKTMTGRIALVEAKGDHVRTQITCKDGTVRFATSSNAGEVVDSAKLPGHPDIEVSVRATLLRRGCLIADKILFSEKSVVMAKADALYLVAALLDNERLKLGKQRKGRK